jgi:hypothetical protein
MELSYIENPPGIMKRRITARIPPSLPEPKQRSEAELDIFEQYLIDRLSLECQVHEN